MEPDPLLPAAPSVTSEAGRDGGLEITMIRPRTLGIDVGAVSTGLSQPRTEMRRLLQLLTSLVSGSPAPLPPLLPPGPPAATLEEAAARLARLSGKPLRLYSTRDFGREQNPAGRSVVVPHAQARPLVERLRREICPGLVAFIGCTNSLHRPPDRGSEVVVAKGNDQFDILRVAASDAINCDMQTEDLVLRLQQYHARFGIDIFHAETDTIEFRLERIPTPAEMAAFCRDLYEFCPDIVDQGAETVEALEEQVSGTGDVFLWWD